MSAAPDVFVGIDLGTTSARVLAVDPDGSLAGRGERPLAGRRAGARHEQDPRHWWDAVAGACRDALREVAAERVGGIAVCATSGTVLLADAGGRPLTTALMYDDARAAGQAARCAMAPSWGLPKLLWLIEHEPSAANAPGARLAHQPDVVTAGLVGRAVATDSSHALKTGFDPAGGEWPVAVRDALGARDGMLGRVVAPGTRLGGVGLAAAERTGLPAGAPVFAGMTDGCAAQIAAGALRPGDWNAVLGTTLVLKGCSRHRIDDPASGVYSHRSPDGAWLPGGASSSGAGVLPAAFPGRDLDALGLRAAEHERTRVLAYPLVSRGERFPIAAPDAEAFLLGAPAGEGEHAAALLQGLALVERLCFERLTQLGAPAAGELTFTGGATRNRRWCQLRSDALDRCARLPERGESAFGMAILATAAAGGEPVADVALRVARTAAVFEPRASMRAHLDEQYARFLAELRRRGWLHAI